MGQLVRNGEVKKDVIDRVDLHGAVIQRYEIGVILWQDGEYGDSQRGDPE